MPVDIRPLTSLSLTDVRRLITGYSSLRRYAVSVDDAANGTTIALRLERLDTPFVKTWSYGRGMVAWYRSLLPSGLSFGAWESDRLIALVVADAQRWNETVMVWELHVEEASRRRGIGRALLAAVEAAAEQGGMRVVSIETQSTNADAIDFYRAAGYGVGGVDLSYYDNDDMLRGEVAVFMKKPLPISS